MEERPHFAISLRQLYEGTNDKLKALMAQAESAVAGC